jgi:hypothetical protein
MIEMFFEIWLAQIAKNLRIRALRLFLLVGLQEEKRAYNHRADLSLLACSPLGKPLQCFLGT